MRIGFHKVRFGEAEKNAVLAALDSNWLSPRGPEVKAFGEKWSQKIDVRHCWPQSSGTGSLHVALAALGVGQGDKVLVPTYTCSPGVFPVSYVGATPIFIDCEPETYGMNPEHLKRVLHKLPDTPKAAIPVHLYGSSCRWEVIELLRDRGIKIISDACESVGATFIDGPTERIVGSEADIGCYSFRGDKVLTALGTGGMTSTDSTDLHQQILYYTDLGLHNTKTMGRYRDLACLGFNYELSNPAAAFAIEQINRLPEIIRDRQAAAATWRQRLDGLDVRLMPHYDGHVYYQFAIWFADLKDGQLDVLGEKLIARGVPFIPPFWPMHMQPQYRDRWREVMVEPCPMAEAAANHVLMLPCYPDLEPLEIAWMAQQIEAAYAKVLAA